MIKKLTVILILFVVMCVIYFFVNPNLVYVLNSSSRMKQNGIVL